MVEQEDLLLLELEFYLALAVEVLDLLVQVQTLRVIMEGTQEMVAVVVEQVQMAAQAVMAVMALFIFTTKEF